MRRRCRSCYAGYSRVVPRSLSCRRSAARRATTSLATSSSRRSLLNAKRPHPGERFDRRSRRVAPTPCPMPGARPSESSAPASSSVASGPGRRVGLHGEHGPRRDVGHHQRVGVLVVGERARPVAVQIERAQPHDADLYGKSEHGRALRRARPEARTPASEPSPGRRDRARAPGGRSSYASMHGPSPSVNCRSSIERAHVIARAQRASGHVPGHQHDARRRSSGDVGGHLAQPGGARFAGGRESRSRIRRSRSPAMFALLTVRCATGSGATQVRVPARYPVRGRGFG